MADARPHPGWLAELWNPSLADSHGRYINQSKRAIMIRQLAHLNFVTNDLSKIIDFYVNKLGMNVKFTLDNKEGKPFGYYFGCGNTTFLEFFDQAMAIEAGGQSGRTYQRHAL